MKDWLPFIAIIATLLIGFGSIAATVHYNLRYAIESNNRLYEQINQRIEDSIAQSDKRIADTHNRIDDSIRSNKEQFQAFLEAWKSKGD